MNIGASAQAALRALIFQSRPNVPVGTTETTNVSVFLTDGTATATDTTTSVVTTGVSGRSAVIVEEDTETLVIPAASLTAI